MKHSSGQDFFLDLFNDEWDKSNLISDVDSAWAFFYEGFVNIVNKHAPLRK